MRLLFTILTLAVAALATPAAAQKCDNNTAKNPTVTTEVFQIASPSGPIGQFRDAYVRVNCDARDPWKWGLTDAEGKLLVPAQYYNVVPLSATSAAVLTEMQYKSDGNALKYKLYIFGKGEQKELLPWSRFGDFSWEGVRTPYAFSIGTGEAALFQGDPARPVVLRNLGWPDGDNILYQAGNTLIANATAEDGTQVSRVLSLRGEPISPVIGAIERWETISAETGRSLGSFRLKSRYDYPTLSIDYISTIITGDHAVLPYGKLYQPIAANGDPLPLPPGAIGVFPLRFDTHTWAGSTTQGWAIVEETPDGLRVRPGLGRLASVLERAASLPAYSGLSRYIERSKDYDDQVWVDVFAARPAGDSVWRFIHAQTLGDAPSGPITSTGLTAHDAIANLVADREATLRNNIAQRERERLAAVARANKEYEERHNWLLASGKICEWAPGGETRGPQTVNYMLVNCPIKTDAFFNYARSIGADPALIDKAEYVYWESRGRYVVPIPSAPNDIYARPNWAAWGDAIVKSARESTDTFIRDSKRTYYSNMEKWNRGKQNWCC